MINIRKALPEDGLFIISNRLDAFVGDRDFFDIPNDILMEKKVEIEKSVKEKYDDCKIVISGGELVGSFAIYQYEDGNLIDSISIKTEVSNPEIKEAVVKFVMSSNYGIIYTFVYKDNVSEIEMFKRLRFEVVSEENDLVKLRLNNF